MIRGTEEYMEEGQRVYDALMAAMPDVTIVGKITGLVMLLDRYTKALHVKEQTSDSASRVLMAQLIAAEKVIDDHSTRLAQAVLDRLNEKG